MVLALQFENVNRKSILDVDRKKDPVGEYIARMYPSQPEPTLDLVM